MYYTLIKKALEYLVDLGQAETIQINNQTYSTRNLSHIKFPKPAELQVNSLSGLVEYIKSDFDNDYFTGVLVHVVSHDKVQLISNILDDAGRETYMVAEAFSPKFSFGQYQDIESFNVAMQACFVQNQDSSKILQVVGNVKEEAVKTTGDDGVSQTVTAKAGIATVAEVRVPNPVMLAPYRTFLEVEQPESKFVFRMRQGPQCALFEADGGAWRLEAMERIKAYLAQELFETSIHIIS